MISLSVQVDLTNKNVSIAVVGKDTPFAIHDDSSVDPYLAGIEGEERRGRGVADAAAPAEGDAPPEDPPAGEADTMETD